MKYLSYVLIGWFLLTGCSSTGAKKPTVKPVSLIFSASGQLNLVRGQARPVHACVYVTKNQDWTPKSLLVEQFDNLECSDPKLDLLIKEAKQIIVVPNRSTTVSVNVEKSGDSWIVLDFNFAEAGSGSLKKIFVRPSSCKKIVVGLVNNYVSHLSCKR